MGERGDDPAHCGFYSSLRFCGAAIDRGVSSGAGRPRWRDEFVKSSDYISQESAKLGEAAAEARVELHKRSTERSLKLARSFERR